MSASTNTATKYPNCGEGGPCAPDSAPKTAEAAEKVGPYVFHSFILPFFHSSFFLFFLPFSLPNHDSLPIRSDVFFFSFSNAPRTHGRMAGRTHNHATATATTHAPAASRRSMPTCTQGVL